MYINRIIKSLCLGVLLLTTLTAQASGWETLKTDGAKLESIDPEWPILLTISPASDSSCAVTGMYVGRYMCSLNGEVWPDGDVMRIKVKGNISSSAKLMIYGTLSYIDAKTAKIDGDLSVDSNGRAQETSCVFYLEDKTAKEKGSHQVVEIDKNSPEYKVLNRFCELWGAGKISLKKDKNIGRLLGAYASEGVDGAINASNNNQTFDVTDKHCSGEIVKCDINDSVINYTLKDGFTGTISVDADYQLSINDIDVFALWSADLSDMIFVCGPSQNRNVIILSGDKLYKTNKNVRKKIIGLANNKMAE